MSSRSIRKSVKFGICLVKDVVSIHALGDEIEAQIETEINAYLAQNNK